MVDKQSEISLLVCLPLALILITVRLVMSTWRRRGVTVGDFWCLMAGLFILGRLIGNHYLLQYGSTRTLDDSMRNQLMLPENADKYKQVVIGSKLIMVTRTFLILALWSAKMAVFDLISRLVVSLTWERQVMRIVRIVLSVTFLISLVSTFVECHPFYLHWQIYPNPGQCVIGNVWMIAYEVCNIITDLLLMAIPFSVSLSVRIALAQRLRLLALFSIGLFLIVISILRIIRGYNSIQQKTQTLWSAVEVLFSVIVAVTPTTYGLIRNTRAEPNSCGHGSHTSKQTDRSRNPHAMLPVSNPDLSRRENPEVYNARVWTEHENGSRTDHSSLDGIIIETQMVMKNSRAEKAGEI